MKQDPMEDLNELTTFWFNNPQLWFDADAHDDQMIQEKFGHLLEIDPSNLTELGPDQALALILVFDQLSRHIYRNDQVTISVHHQKALGIANYMIEWDMDLVCTPEQRTFILLPLRHTFELSELERVIHRIFYYRSWDDHPVYPRFLKATLYSYSKLLVPTIAPTTPLVNPPLPEIKSILDPSSVTNLTEIVDISKNHPIYRAFLSTYKKLNRPDGITVSLSGGVDSMVVLHNVCNLAKKYNFQVVAVHINYNNRETCDTEVSLLRTWCDLLQVPLYVRQVWELKRDRSYDRALYEKVTRRFRFDMYRRFGYPVILGHNRDDTVENIFANIRKSRSLNNLKGMSEIGEEDGVNIIRPMLDVPKADIYEFANDHLIPHLEDSTPKWSDRGRMRDALVPAMNSLDSTLIPSLVSMAEFYRDVFEMVNVGLIGRFYSSVNLEDRFIPLKPDDPEAGFGFVFWKEIMIRFFKELGLPQPSNKAIQTMVKRVNHSQYGRINVGKNTVFNYSPEGLQLN